MPRIIPIRDLKNTSELSCMVKESSEPVYVTKNGYGEMVIMSMEAYEENAERLRALEDYVRKEAVCNSENKAEMPSDDGKAYLSNEKDMIVFRHGGTTIRFRGPYSLEHFTSIKEWDKGYLVVMAKYEHNDEPEEEYIDLIPILKDLEIEPSAFLNSITEVRLDYGRY